MIVYCSSTIQQATLIVLLLRNVKQKGLLKTHAGYDVATVQCSPPDSLMMTMDLLFKRGGGDVPETGQGFSEDQLRRCRRRRIEKQYHVGQQTIIAGKSKKEDTDKVAEADESSVVASDVNPSTTKPAPSPSLFMNLGCGFVDTFTTNVADACHFSSKPEEPTEVPQEDDTGGSFISGSSVNTSSQLTALEKAVWNDWDKKEKPDKKWDGNKSFEKKEEHGKKREVARGKLLEFASSALSSHTMKEEEHPSSSYTDEGSTDSSSGGSSGDSGESGMTGPSTENGQESNTESYSVTDSDFVSDTPSADKLVKQPVTTPILLSFSQRSLIEKFSKQLATDGVEVLKLNRRKQWQARYFTVSREQIALVAHEAKSKSGDVTQCPKALLWLKKFNAKSGGYGITTIDKNGHGGMLLVDLADVPGTREHGRGGVDYPKEAAGQV